MAKRFESVRDDRDGVFDFNKDNIFSMTTENITKHTTGESHPFRLTVYSGSGTKAVLYFNTFKSMQLTRRVLNEGAKTPKKNPEAS